MQSTTPLGTQEFGGRGVGVLRLRADQVIGASLPSRLRASRMTNLRADSSYIFLSSAEAAFFSSA
jgi:hypothetical protein